MASNQLRNLPSVERVANHGDLADLVAAYGRGWVVELARNAVSEARQRVLAGAAAPSETDIVGRRRRSNSVGYSVTATGHQRDRRDYPYQPRPRAIE